MKSDVVCVVGALRPFQTGYSERKNQHVVSVVGIGQCSKSGMSDSKSDVVCVVRWANPFQTGYSEKSRFGTLTNTNYRNYMLIFSLYPVLKR